jgi:hypothetical protein
VTCGHTRIQEGEGWDSVSPPCSRASKRIGQPSSNRMLSRPHVRQRATPPGATACSRPSRRSGASCCRSSMATPRAAICRICPVYGSARRPIVKPVRHSLSTSLHSCWHASALPCTPTWPMRGGGMGIAPFSSRPRAVPGLIPRLCRPPSASRRSSGLGAAFPSPGYWGCSTRAPVCS